MTKAPTKTTIEAAIEAAKAADAARVIVERDGTRVIIDLKQPLDSGDVEGFNFDHENSDQAA